MRPAGMTATTPGPGRALCGGLEGSPWGLHAYCTYIPRKSGLFPTGNAGHRTMVSVKNRGTEGGEK